MRLGTRWPLGSPPPRGLPPSVATAIATVEARATDAAAGTSGGSSTSPGARRATPGWGWTLTWLEGAAVATLDDGTTVRQDPVSGEVRITGRDDEAEADPDL